MICMMRDTNGGDKWASSSLNSYLNGEYLTSLGSGSNKIADATWKVRNVNVGTTKQTFESEITNASKTNGSNNGIVRIDLDGNFSIFPAAMSRNVYPSFYLLSSVAYSKGDGASSSPFRIE